MSAHKEVAKSLRRFNRRGIRHHVNDLSYGVVVATDPLAVELEDGLRLDDDDLTLGYTVRKFDKDNTLDVGDTLVVKLMANGDWLATEVVTDREVA